LVGNIERKREFGRPRHRWQDNIKTYLTENVCGLGLDPFGSG
jgi:hypothetical protein